MLSLFFINSCANTVLRISSNLQWCKAKSGANGRTCFVCEVINRTSAFCSLVVQSRLRRTCVFIFNER